MLKDMVHNKLYLSQKWEEKSFPDTIKMGDKVLTEPAEMANYFNATLYIDPENGYKRYLNRTITSSFTHGDVIKWLLVNSPHKDQWREALMFPLICV